jgi:hypothetical protein
LKATHPQSLLAFLSAGSQFASRTFVISVVACSANIVNINSVGVIQSLKFQLFIHLDFIQVLLSIQAKAL